MAVSEWPLVPATWKMSYNILSLPGLKEQVEHAYHDWPRYSVVNGNKTLIGGVNCETGWVPTGKIIETVYDKKDFCFSGSKNWREEDGKIIVSTEEKVFEAQVTFAGKMGRQDWPNKIAQKVATENFWKIFDHTDEIEALCPVVKFKWPPSKFPLPYETSLDFESMGCLFCPDDHSYLQKVLEAHVYPFTPNRDQQKHFEYQGFEFIQMNSIPKKDFAQHLKYNPDSMMMTHRQFEETLKYMTLPEFATNMRKVFNVLSEYYCEPLQKKVKIFLLCDPHTVCEVAGVHKIFERIKTILNEASNHPKCLILEGRPGVGKTELLSIASRYIDRNEQSLMIISEPSFWFYNNFWKHKDNIRSKAIEIWRSILLDIAVKNEWNVLTERDHRLIPALLVPGRKDISEHPVLTHLRETLKTKFDSTCFILFDDDLKTWFENGVDNESLYVYTALVNQNLIDICGKEKIPFEVIVVRRGTGTAL